MRRAAWFVILSLASVPAAVGQARPPGLPPSKPKLPVSPDGGVEAVSGAYAYRTSCASCHGPLGKGDGPLAESLRFTPPDLSLIAKRNGGEYPAETVHRIVDGRRPLPGHGGPDMPIWGDAFKNPETGFDDASVKGKIRAVVEYVRTLQAK
jgi:mono/diheme cytochrome c family protein